MQRHISILYALIGLLVCLIGLQEVQIKILQRGMDQADEHMIDLVRRIGHLEDLAGGK